MGSDGRKRAVIRGKGYMEDANLQERIVAPRNYLFMVAVLVLLMAGTVYGSLFVKQTNARTAETIAAYIHDVVISARTGLGAADEARLAHVILGESKAHNIDPLFILALIKTESELKNWSRSSKGALGLMQILPSTGREIAGRLRLKWRGEATLFNPYTNVKMGVYYFNSLNSRYDNNIRLSLAAYNAGPGRVSASMETGSEISGAFSDRVLQRYSELKARSEDYTID